MEMFFISQLSRATFVLRALSLTHDLDVEDNQRDSYRLFIILAAVATRLECTAYDLQFVAPCFVHLHLRVFSDVTLSE